MLRLVAAPLAFLVTSLLVAGCIGDSNGEGDTSTTTTAAPTVDPCPDVTETSTVPTWTKHGGHWGDALAMEGHTTVVCGKATSSLNNLVSDLAGPFTDFELTVAMDQLAGDLGVDPSADTTHAGAGVVIHYADEDNYNIVRYSPREQGWHLFTVIDGDRNKQRDATVEGSTTNPEYHQWVTLRVRSEGGHVTAFDGGTKVIDFMLPAEASHTGRVGYFLRDAGMVALFDDFRAAGL